VQNRLTLIKLTRRSGIPRCRCWQTVRCWVENECRIANRWTGQ